LNVIRYNAGLIQTVSESDFYEFRTESSIKSSYAYYQDRCMFEMRNKHEYALFLTLFIENLSAASFSLFDVSAHLLKDIFDLPLPRQNIDGRITADISYKNALQENKLSNGFPALYNFLYRYRATSRSGNASPDQVSWIDPLETIRHHITHQPVTNIVKWEATGDLHTTENAVGFFINHDFFNNQPRGDELKMFAEKCFDGIEEFVDQLFQHLTVEVNNSGFVPI
jgi:hypothetical protein